MRNLPAIMTSPVRLAALALSVMLCACSTYEHSMLPGSATSLAQDRIMMVRKSPPTFGYQRLLDHCRTYPDFDVFVRREGVPDFLAETRNDGRQYMILYYLPRRQAYACRAHAGRGRGIEFSGPYPITPGEFKVLDDFRKQNAG